MSIIRQYRPSSPIIATTLIAATALQPSVSPLPLTLLLAGILIQTSRIAADGNRQTRHNLGLVLSLTLGGVAARIIPSLHALSTPSTSIVVLVAGSLTTSILYLVPALLYVITLTVPPSASSSERLLSLFPAIWTTYIALISYWSPFGRIGTWSPVLSDQGTYSWLAPYFGAPGQDWLVSASAALLAQFVEQSGWMETNPSESKARKISSDDHPPLIDITEEIEGGRTAFPPYHDDESDEMTDVERQSPSSTKSFSYRSSPQTRRTMAMLTATLIALAIPSYFNPSLPLPPQSDKTIQLDLACILPQPASEASPKTIFDHYLAESAKYGSLARIHLWPESAVRFENVRERDEGLKAVQLLAKVYKIWIGVGLEYTLPAIEGGKRRNGIAIVGPEGVALEYYKHNLVPGESIFAKFQQKYSIYDF